VALTAHAIKGVKCAAMTLTRAHQATVEAAVVGVLTAQSAVAVAKDGGVEMTTVAAEAMTVAVVRANISLIALRNAQNAASMMSLRRTENASRERRKCRTTGDKTTGGSSSTKETTTSN